MLLSCCCLIEGVGFQSARESEERRSHRVGSRVAFVQTQQMGQQLSRIMGFIAINRIWELHTIGPALC